MDKKIRDALDPIRADDALKDATRRYLADQRKRRTRPPAVRAFRRPLAALCAVILVILLGAGAYRAVRTPVAYVSIDVNPSIELALNRFDRVVSATAWNSDGQTVLQGLALDGRPYTEAIDTIVESPAMATYLSGSADLTFTVAAQGDDEEAALRAGIASCEGCRAHSGQSDDADVALVEEAHENGLSLGKYQAYLTLSSCDPTLTLDVFRTLTMAQIHSRMAACGITTGQSSCNGSGSAGTCDGSGSGNGRDSSGGESGKGCSH